MSKKIYVNGGIVVTTPFFREIEASAFYETPPEGAEVLEPNEIDENGYAYLEISEDNPQSIFNEYYAKYDYATYGCAPFLYNNYEDVHNNYKERIGNIKEIIDLHIESEKHQDILYRMFYMNIITSLETFISDIVVTKTTRTLKDMQTYATQIAKNRLKKSLGAKWEQDIMEFAIRQPYSNIDHIINDLKVLFNVSFFDIEDKIDNHFYHRHLLAHKNGRQKDNEYFTPTKETLFNLIKDTDNFANQIYDKVSDAENSNN